MSVELRPLGVKCNLQCVYCYQNAIRDAGNTAKSYDLDRMKESVDKCGGPFTLFGGEPLLIPLPDLENLWSWGYEKYGRNGMQTNATLVGDEHVRLFRQYNVNVGISIDGPGELNDARWHGTLRRTRDATARTEAAIERLCAEGLTPGLIVTLHRLNAAADRLPRMAEWVRHLDQLGIAHVRLHTLEVDHADVRDTLALSRQENIDAWLAFAALETELKQLRFAVFGDIRELLLGNDRGATCVWNACDPYTTWAVQGVEGTGQSSNCGRTNKDGIDYPKADLQGFERYMALYHTPQEFGGCQGCRFFLMCKGECPGTALDGDWRNRTEHCDLWKALFGLMEERLLAEGADPLSRSPIRPSVEQAMYQAWESGSFLSLENAVRRVRGGTPDGEGVAGSDAR